MPVVEVNGQEIEFPDDMGMDQIKAVLQKKFPAQQQASQPTGLARTVFDQVGQGLSFGFMDEMQDVLGALGAKAYDKISGENVLPSFSETVKMAREGTKERLAGELRDRPVTSIASNIAGSLVTGGALGGTKAGKAVADSIRTGLLPNATGAVGKAANFGSKMLVGGLSGGAAGAGYGLGAGDDTLASRAESAIRGGVLGAVAGAAAPAVVSGLSKLAGDGTKKIIPTADQLRKLSGDKYKFAAEQGGLLKPEFTDKFVDEIQKMKPQTEIGQIVGGDSAFTKVVEKLSAIRGKPMTLDAAQELDEFLGDAVDEMTDMGRVTKQGKKLLDIQTSLRGMIEDAGDDVVVGGKEGFAALKEARKMWSDSRKLSDIERIIARASMTDNPATSIKTGFRTLASNPNRLKGYTPAEKKAIESAAESGVVGDALRTMLGSRLLSSIYGMAGGGLPGAAVGSLTSIAARGGAEALQAGRANKVAEMIAGKYATTQAAQPPLHSLLSYIPPTPGMVPASTAEQMARILQQR